MRKLALMGLGLFALVQTTGCVYMAAVKSVQGKAYVVKATPFGSSLWNCDATSGDPVCYRVVEVPAAGK